MKQSKFNILIVPPEAPTQAILYNTFHDHRIILNNTDNHVVNFFNKIDSGKSLSDEESATASTLHELGILLDDDANEKEIFDRWYFNKIQNPKGILNLILVTTMACNLRCPYCYEKDQLDNKRNMSDTTADNFVEWVKNEVRKNPIEALEIVYFGGEPLMNKNVLYHISEKLQKFCADYGIAYHGKMVTNGVMLTPEVAKKLRQVGVTKIKVTLDGDKHTHDTTRITASGRGSFDQIWYNMEHANDDLQENEDPIKFVIGGNFLDETYEGFFPLLDKLANASFKNHIDMINLKPVQDVTTNSKTNLSANPCDINCFNEKNTSRMIKLREELVKRDLPPTDGLNLGPCDFYRGDSYTLDLNGYIYPCIAFADNHSCAIGHIDNEQPVQKHQDKFQEWLNTKPWTEDCYDCSFLPVCTGGCRATAYSNGYDWSSTVCEKDYFKRMSKALAKEMLGVEEPVEETPAAAEMNLATVPNQDLDVDTKEFYNASFIKNENKDFLIELQRNTMP